MKILLPMIIRVLIYFLFALLIFLMMINFLRFPTITQNVSLEKKVEVLEKHREQAVLRDITNNSKVFDIEHFKWKEEFIFLEYISKETSQVLPLIYLFIMFTFLIQVMLLALSNYYKELIEYFGEKKVDSLFIYTSEWTINAPPVLGVVGTIFSFGIVVSNLSDMSSLTTLFKENFADAALTTIIGGLVYVFNLLINIFVIQNLSIKK